MKRLIILGAGTAGTTTGNRLRELLPDWLITVVDRDNMHHYQPGYLFVPFGELAPSRIVKRRRPLLAPGIDLVIGAVEHVDAANDTVLLADGRQLPYDQLVIATGTRIRPDQTPGMDGALWHEDVFDFYTLEGATALRDRLAAWGGGRLVVHITEMPIKCPVAPLEFSFLADDFFRRRGMRDRVEITFVTPLDGAFTKPIASAKLGGMLEERKIHVEPDFVIERIDNEAHAIVSWDEREIPFDLLVTVPLHMGADFVGRSGLGDELNHVKVDPHTFQSRVHDNIFALGDAADLPTSKAGSVAHFAVDVFADNFLEHIAGKPMTHRFDGHANCFVETGDGKALLLDFNYETQPLPGRFPVPGIGPLRLLEETRANHWGKLAFEWIYWHLLLPGHRLPVSTDMSMRGKNEPPDDLPADGSSAGDMPPIMEVFK